MRRFFLFILLFPLLMISEADGASIDIEEQGSVLNYYDMYYVVDVAGNVTMTNDEDFPINTVELRTNPGTLSLDELGGTGYLYDDKIRIPYLDPGESRTIEYRIYGLTTENVIRYYESDGESVLNHLMDEKKLYYRSDLWINLRKSEIFGSGDLRRRTIDIEVTNPHPLEYNIDSVKVYRTDDADVNDPDRIWTFDDVTRIHGGDSWSRSFSDESEDMREDSVYWFVVDHELSGVLADISEDNDIDIHDESELEDVPSEDPEEQDVSERDKELRERTLVFLRKLIDPSTVYPGDSVNVTLIVTNLDAMPKTIDVHDTIPDGFELDEVYTQDSLIESDDDVAWQVEVNRDTSKIIEYSVKFIDEESLGMDYFPEADAIFAEGRVSSSRTPYIKRFIPDKKLYVQKNIMRLPGDRVEIEISIRNIGESSVSGLVLKDHITDDSSFSDFTKEHIGRGEWEIPSLDRDEEWTVSYRTDFGRGITRLPQLMGIEESSVLKTIIMDSHVSHTILSPSANIFEIIGIAILIVFPFLFIRIYKKKIVENKV
ncbi:MAG: hypothetical protein ACLFTR_00325 [Candidatus Woesearchaeota archaeon]